MMEQCGCEIGLRARPPRHHARSHLFHRRRPPPFLDLDGGFGIGRVVRGGSSPTALGVLLSLRMLTVRTDAFADQPMFRSIWFLGSIIP